MCVSWFYVRGVGEGDWNLITKTNLALNPHKHTTTQQQVTQLNNNKAEAYASLPKQTGTRYQHTNNPKQWIEPKRGITGKSKLPK